MAQLHLLLFMVIAVASTKTVVSQLQYGYYMKTCPEAEFIVQQVITKAFAQNPRTAAALIRMHFHDCFVHGCDASILIDSTSSNTAEKDSPANNPSLTGFDIIDEAKKKLEAACPGVVSCADILAYAARDCAKLAGGFMFGWDVKGGRKDGKISRASDITANLPAPTFNLSQLTQLFAQKGLTQEEMVTLSGGHTVGRSHCSSFTSRLYNFSTTQAQDPSLDASLVAMLRARCPQTNSNPSTTVPMEQITPTVLDNTYYDAVLNKRGLFTSDKSLLDSDATAALVSQNSADPVLWARRFNAAMAKMSEIQVLTGDQGAIRTNCHVV